MIIVKYQKNSIHQFEKKKKFAIKISNENHLKFQIL